MTQTFFLTILALSLLALSGCGVDGAPTRPAEPPPGLHISGEARMGVVSKL